MIIYEGPSEINGKPVVAILTGWQKPSSNIKTGDMAQVWILSKELHPWEAVKQKEDAAICGNCKHRGASCYVTVAQAPSVIWKAYKAGKYKMIPPNFKLNKPLRFGAYGDIAAVPLWAIEPLMGRKNTCYTHQWETFDLSDFSMASVDNLDEKKDAITKGYRTFRVSQDAKLDLQPDEIICPNETHGIQCRDCGLCSGNQVRGKNIVVTVHGTKAKISKFSGQ